MNDKLRRELQHLYDDLLEADWWAEWFEQEQAEIYRIRALNKLIELANRNGFSQLAFLARS